MVDDGKGPLFRLPIYLDGEVLKLCVTWTSKIRVLFNSLNKLFCPYTTYMSGEQTTYPKDPVIMMYDIKSQGSTK